LKSSLALNVYQSSKIVFQFIVPYLIFPSDWKPLPVETLIGGKKGFCWEGRSDKNQSCSI